MLTFFRHRLHSRKVGLCRSLCTLTLYIIIHYM
nr:MAG TPA: hypothetical protein [Caudoviricetes sp.]